MTKTISPTLLFRMDPTRNMARFYFLAIESTLFGGSSLTRSWGRIGTKGQMRVDLFDTAAEAVEASSQLLQRKFKRGYRQDAEEISPR
ncbi:WGR domain-containing protein [Rhizobium binae]|uniref:WGR domain-containing protein n=1 Tax=Rhizobium binae TaxID=1138190 RepID=UPI001C83BCCF|nr:WGR domain-containing protein [Rhizobium binae]MBX4948699.1 WGR domain-containing protein [Rhizobium binae]